MSHKRDPDKRARLETGKMAEVTGVGVRGGEYQGAKTRGTDEALYGPELGGVISVSCPLLLRM